MPDEKKFDELLTESGELEARMATWSEDLVHLNSHITDDYEPEELDAMRVYGPFTSLQETIVNAMQDTGKLHPTVCDRHGRLISLLCDGDGLYCQIDDCPTFQEWVWFYQLDPRNLIEGEDTGKIRIGLSIHETATYLAMLDQDLAAAVSSNGRLTGIDLASSAVSNDDTDMTKAQFDNLMAVGTPIDVDVLLDRHTPNTGESDGDAEIAEFFHTSKEAIEHSNPEDKGCSCEITRYSHGAANGWIITKVDPHCMLHPQLEEK